MKYARKLIGYGTTHLHSGSFSTGRAAKQVSQHRSYVNKGSHPKRNNIMGRTDFFYQEVISLCRSPSPIMIHQSNKQTGYRQESNNPKVVFAIVCFYQEVISLCRSPSPIMIHQSNKQTGYRQESNNPKVVFAIVCCPIKRN